MAQRLERSSKGVPGNTVAQSLEHLSLHTLKVPVRRSVLKTPSVYPAIIATRLSSEVGIRGRW